MSRLQSAIDGDYMQSVPNDGDRVRSGVALYLGGDWCDAFPPQVVYWLFLATFSFHRVPGLSLVGIRITSFASENGWCWFVSKKKATFYEKQQLSRIEANIE